MPPGPVVLVINPISGTGGRRDVVTERVHLAREFAEAQGLELDICVSEHGGHACDLTTRALADDASVVVAWGGDGTINEVASTLAFTGVPLGIVPAGSGNGLARELGIPFDPHAALEIATGTRERTIDAGEMDGRLFFNVSGIGLDARVAHAFAARGLERRGFRRYLELTVRELFRHEPDEYAVAVGGERLRRRALMIAVANSRQYGNGALIAPAARLDDGLLDLVVIGERSPWRAVTQIPRIFAGQVGRVAGVHMLRGAEAEIRGTQPIRYHVDGEPHIGGDVVRVRCHPSALRVRVA